jgi:hypothetical protein
VIQQCLAKTAKAGIIIIRHFQKLQVYGQSSAGIGARFWIPKTFSTGGDAAQHVHGPVTRKCREPAGGRQVFGEVAKSDTAIAMLIRRSVETLGWTGTTDLTAFTDGCSGLQSILTAAGVTKPPILDWFHIAMRLQHAKQAATGLSTEAL